MLGRLRNWLSQLAISLVPIGHQNDGVDKPLFSRGTEIDKSWTQLYGEFKDAREAWQLIPLVRRMAERSVCAGKVAGS